MSNREIWAIDGEDVISEIELLRTNLSNSTEKFFATIESEISNSGARYIDADEVIDNEVHKDLLIEQLDILKLMIYGARNNIVNNNYGLAVNKLAECIDHLCSITGDLDYE